MRKYLELPLACIAIAALPMLASAQTECPGDLQSLAGGQVYFNDGGTLKPFSLASLPPREFQRVRLFYVVRTSTDRSGVIVIKSARIGAATDASARDVKLVRRSATSVCGSVPQGYAGHVARAAYQEYHDLGKESGGSLNQDVLGRLKRFHTAYEASSGDPKSCRTTDTKLGPDGFYEKWNNRSQFSFDTGIVDTGHDPAIYQIASGIVTTGFSWIIPSAIAGPDRISNRYVEIKRYSTSGGVACIPFTMSIRGAGQVLRVNDIEGRRSNVKEYRIGDLN